MDEEEADFQKLVGPWEPLAPVEVAALFADAPFRWWLAGGWSVELAGGRSRPHEDTDAVFLREDLAAVREWLADYHLWIPNPGSLVHLPPGAELPADEEQLWLRRDGLHPWILDLLFNPGSEDEWIFKRNPDIRLPFADAVMTVEGVSILRPHVTLLHKAKNGRAKDDGDFDSLLPLLSSDEVRWLRNALAVEHPGHPWGDRLS